MVVQIPKRPIAPEENTEWKYKYTAAQRSAGMPIAPGMAAGSSLHLVADPYARKFVPPQRRGGDEFAELPPPQKRRKKASNGDDDDDEDEDAEEDDDNEDDE